MKGFSEPATDWKGNLIKAGDIVVRIGTQPLFGSQRFGLLDLKNGGFEQIGETYHPPENIWEVGPEYLIQEIDGKLFYEYGRVLSSISMIYWGQDSDIICIKGVSDSEEEYYLHYFKNKV